MLYEGIRQPNSSSLHKAPKLLVHFLLFISFGSHSELGYDPTVWRVAPEKKDEPMRFVYKVNNEYSVTSGPPISDRAAHDIVSRATRVWRVHRCQFNIKTNTPYEVEPQQRALKDYWNYAGCDGELAIQNSILDRLDEKNLDRCREELRQILERRNYSKRDISFFTELSKGDAKKYFMSIMHDWAVKIEDKDDITPSPPARYQPFVLTVHVQKIVTSPTARSGTTDNAYVPQPVKPNPAKVYCRDRQHWRSVYEEVCLTIPEIDDWVNLVRCLRDNAKGICLSTETCLLRLADFLIGLFYMFIARYVHRDISAGNCLLAKRGGVISDLEYARPYESTSQGDRRTVSICTEAALLCILTLS